MTVLERLAQAELLAACRCTRCRGSMPLARGRAACTRIPVVGSQVPKGSTLSAWLTLFIAHSASPAAFGASASASTGGRVLLRRASMCSTCWLALECSRVSSSQRNDPFNLCANVAEVYAGTFILFGHHDSFDQVGLTRQHMQDPCVRSRCRKLHVVYLPAVPPPFCPSPAASGQIRAATAPDPERLLPGPPIWLHQR